jgi:hypothetical protein
MIKVDKHIPFPKSMRGRPKRFPFGTMKVGDSFRFKLRGELDARGRDRQMVSVEAAGCKYSVNQAIPSRLRCRFSVRKISDNYARCWRVS